VKRPNRTQAWIAGGVVAAVVAATTAIALAGGHHRASTASTTSAPRASSTTRAPRPRPHGVIAPLTGLLDPTSGAATRPALTVKIENDQNARPQMGLDQADDVYEEVVEGGITRLLAIFQSHVPPVIGPIRSVRRTDQSVVTPLGGIFVYSGGAPYAIASIHTAPVTLVDETRAGSAMFRDPSRVRPYNLFGHPSALFAFGGTPVPPNPLFSYRRAHEAVPGTRVTSFNVGFGAGFSVTYHWSAPLAAWSRSVDHPSLEASDPHVAPRNVIVMFVNYAGGVGVIGSEAQLVGAGSATVFTAGHEITGRWVRPDLSRPAQFFDTAGALIRLTPGQTWVELGPIGTPVTAS
jgi:hypothetical protein